MVLLVRDDQLLADARVHHVELYYSTVQYAYMSKSNACEEQHC
jgi:hypothetical protein